MLDLRKIVIECIKQLTLPPTLSSFSDTLFDEQSQTFVVQESLHWDYKDTFPRKLTSDFGTGIVRLICAFHNTYGGLIIFGVDDETKRPIGNSQRLDVERFNAFLRGCLSSPIECIHREYVISNLNRELRIDILLVPKRQGGTPPIRNSKQIGKYGPGCIFHRQGHEVVQATTTTLPLLYTSRADDGLESDRHATVAIERSIPPSTATMREFIGRRDVMDRLWRWLIYDDDPRFYLYGRGGSGKSTIAYDFAKRVSDSWKNQPIADGQSLDLVVYLSAKKQELNAIEGKIQKSEITDFETTREQFVAIIEAAGGFGAEGSDNLSDEAIVDRLKNVFAQFTILLVIDDIDTLTTRGLDSGSDVLYRILARAQKGGKVLYTLREEPLLSANQSQVVTGLDLELEYIDFVSSCCKQFRVKEPPPEFMMSRLANTSECLPLVLETIIGFRRTTSTYLEATDLWLEKRGEEAREYLFRREYDRLALDNRARNLLLLLLLLETPTPTSVLLAILRCTPNQLADSIAATKDLFLTIDDDSEGESLFSIGAVTGTFVGKVSTELPHYQTLCERVSYYKSEKITQSPEISAIAMQLQRRLSEGDFIGAREFYESVDMRANVSEHPKIQHFAGDIYAKQDPPDLERARQHYSSAVNAEYLDRTMMRNWFYMELNQGLFARAAKVCRMVVDRDRFSAAARSEFEGKRGLTYKSEARQLMGDSPTSGVKKYLTALNAYAISVDIAFGDRGSGFVQSLRHFEICLREFSGNCVLTGHQATFCEFWSRGNFGKNLQFDLLYGYLKFVCAQIARGTLNQLGERKGALQLLRSKIVSPKTQFGSDDARRNCASLIDGTIDEIDEAIVWSRD